MTCLILAYLGYISPTKGVPFRHSAKEICYTLFHSRGKGHATLGATRGLYMSHTGHRSHGWEWDTENSMQQIASSQPVQSASPSQTTLANNSRLRIHAPVPPSTDTRAILQRADEVNTILGMLGEAQNSTVVLTGDAGAGKSTLAALVYRQLQLAGERGATPFQQFIWLTLGPNATLPDCLAALMGGINAGTLPADFLLLKPAHQIPLLFNALSRRGHHAAIFILLHH